MVCILDGDHTVKAFPPILGLDLVKVKDKIIVAVDLQPMTPLRTDQGFNCRHLYDKAVNILPQASFSPLPDKFQVPTETIDRVS